MPLRWSALLIAGTLAASTGYAQELAKPDPAKAQGIVTSVCAACHAPDGNSVQPTNPILAAQHAEYTFKQLMNFKPQGGKPAERTNAVMNAMVGNLSAGDMRNLAAYFEGQKGKPRTARDPGLVKAGQTIYRAGSSARGVAACTACHGPNGAGIPAQYPRLAGQFSEYVSAQLKAFRSGERTNDTNRVMRSIAEKLSDKDIAALAEYISGLR